MSLSRSFCCAQELLTCHEGDVYLLVNLKESAAVKWLG